MKLIARFICFLWIPLSFSAETFSSDIICSRIVAAADRAKSGAEFLADVRSFGPMHTLEVADVLRNLRRRVADDPDFAVRTAREIAMLDHLSEIGRRKPKKVIRNYSFEQQFIDLLTRISGIEKEVSPTQVRQILAAVFFFQDKKAKEFIGQINIDETARLELFENLKQMRTRPTLFEGYIHYVAGDEVIMQFMNDLLSFKESSPERMLRRVQMLSLEILTALIPQDATDWKALEIGYGNGSVTRLLPSSMNLRLGIEPPGAGPTRQPLRGEQFLDISFPASTADFQRLENAGPFDVIHATDLFHTPGSFISDSKTELRVHPIDDQALSQVFKLLRPGGYFLIVVGDVYGVQLTPTYDRKHLEQTSAFEILVYAQPMAPYLGPFHSESFPTFTLLRRPEVQSIRD